MKPYNEIQIIGPSPVQTNVRSAEWGSEGGSYISIKPTSFGDVIDRPERELERDYEIVSEPDKEVDLTYTVNRVLPGPSPEDQFRAANDDAGLKQSTTREETPLADKTPAQV